MRATPSVQQRSGEGLNPDPRRILWSWDNQVSPWVYGAVPQAMLLANSRMFCQWQVLLSWYFGNYLLDGPTISQVESELVEQLSCVYLSV